MTRLWQFWQGHPKPAFSEKVQGGDRGKFFKNRPKGCPRLKGPKALWRKWHYPLNKNALKVQRLETNFGLKSGSKSARMAKLLQFSQGYPKPAFSEKVQRGDQRKFFKKSPKKMTSLKRPKSTVTQMALSSKKYALKV